MTGPDPKADLHHYLQVAREALLWKLEGPSEYDIRRPLTPTGTNLLGLIKHAASVELGYFGETFGRPSDDPLPWFEDGAEPNADMWATAGESRAEIVGLYHRAWTIIDGTVGLRHGNDNMAPGDEAWWKEYRSRLESAAREAL